LRQGGKTLGYYNSAAGSYGLQAGLQWLGSPHDLSKTAR
jgi:hypothetical protein